MALAVFASFFSLATTFSLPGMITYSVAKLSSRSTPSDFLGKSLMCPSEASTSYPAPRYFWIVFALAGDSTMTKPFDNGTSIFQITFTKLARFRREGQSGHAVRYSLFAFRSSPEGQLQLMYHGCSRVSSLAIRHHPVAAFVAPRTEERRVGK